jgi:hypothetical protein
MTTGRASRRGAAAAGGAAGARVAGTRAAWDIEGVPGVAVLFFIVVIIVVFVSGWI